MASLDPRLPFLAILLLLPATAHAQGKPPPRFHASAPLLPLARPGAWLPVLLDVDSGPAVRGEVRIDFGDSSAPPTVRDFDAARDSARRLVLPVHAPAWAEELRVVVRDSRGRHLHEERLPVRPGTLDPDALRVAVVGEDPAGWTTVRRIGGGPVVGHPTVADEGSREVRVETLLPRDLPESWFAWTSVDLLVWPRPEPARLQPEQQQALRDWVAAGGTLLLSAGDNPDAWSASPLATLAPVDFGPITLSPDGSEVLAGLLGSPDSAAASSNTLAPPLPLPIAPLLPRPERHGLVHVRPPSDQHSHRHPLPVAQDGAGRLLIASSRVGAGTVAVLAFDVLGAETLAAVDRASMWRRLFGLGAPPPGAPDASAASALASLAPPSLPLLPLPLPAAPCPASGAASDSSSWLERVQTAVATFAAAAPLSLSFILAFGAAYLLFIGPVDFLVLRRLKRPMWTWLSFPLIAMAFSAGATVLIAVQKRGGSEMRCVEVVDVLRSAGAIRGSARCGVWSDRSGRVELAIPRGSGAARVSAGGPSAAFGAAGLIPGTDSQPVDDAEDRVSPGDVRARGRLAQWSVSQVEGAWIERARSAAAEGGPGTPAAWSDESALHNDSGFDLDEAWLVAPGGAFPLGALRSGASAPLPSPDTAGSPLPEVLAAAHEHGRELADPLESLPGHLHILHEIDLSGEALDPGDWLVGLVRQPIAPPRISGRDVAVSGVALVRIPMERAP